MTRKRRAHQRQRGAALLLAMLILTLVTTVAAAMVWHQHRAIELEAAVRARNQAGVMVLGGFDAVIRTILAVGEVPKRKPLVLEPARIGPLLAVDQENNADTVLDAFISGRIVDVQGRYNLRNLLGPDGKLVDAERAGLQRLCAALGLSQDVATRIAEGLVASWTGKPDAVLPPSQLSQLTWLGIDAATIARLRGYVDILPVRTPVNAVSARAEVLLAAIDKIDPATASGVVRESDRLDVKFDDARLRTLVPSTIELNAARVATTSRFFEITGTVRLEERAIEERVLVEHKPGGSGAPWVILRHERLPPPPPLQR